MTAGVIVDEVEEVLTIEEGQVDDLPAAAPDVDRGDRQDRRPPDRPAQHRRHLRRARPDGPGRRLGTDGCRNRLTGSSSPTTRAFMRQVLTSRSRAGGASTSWASAADGDEALALCREPRPDVLSLDLAMPGRDGIGRAARAAREQVADRPWSSSRRSRPLTAPVPWTPWPRAPSSSCQARARRVPVATSPRSSAQKVALAAAVRAAPRPVQATPPCAAHAPHAARRRAQRHQQLVRHRLLDRRAAGARRAAAQAARAARGRHAHRPAHAAGLHRARWRSGSTARRAARARGARRRDDRAGQAPCSPPAAATCRLDGGGTAELSDECAGRRPAPARRPDDRRRGRRSTATACCSSCSPAWARTGSRARARCSAPAAASSPRPSRTCTVYGMPRAIAEAGLADAIIALHDLPAAIAAEAGR